MPKKQKARGRITLVFYDNTPTEVYFSGDVTGRDVSKARFEVQRGYRRWNQQLRKNAAKRQEAE